MVLFRSSLGSDYSKLGHAEAVSVVLDAITGSIAREQVGALAALYFEHGFFGNANCIVMVEVGHITVHF